MRTDTILPAVQLLPGVGGVGDTINPRQWVVKLVSYRGNIFNKKFVILIFGEVRHGENSGVSVLGGALYENMNVCSARRCFENRGIFGRVPVIDDKIFTLCHGGVSAPRVDIPSPLFLSFLLWEHSLFSSR